MSGRQPRQTFGDDAVGGEIGLRHRRSVGLAVDLHGGAVDGEDGGAGPDHEVGQRLDQRGGGVAVESGGRASFMSGLICCSSCLTIAALCWQHAAAQCIKPSSMRDS